MALAISLQRDSQAMGCRKRRRLQFLSARFLMTRLRYINDNVVATLRFLRRLNVCKKIFQYLILQYSLNAKCSDKNAKRRL